MKLLLLVLALATIASAAVYRTHLRKIESERMRLLRLGKLREHSLRVNQLRYKGIGHQGLIDYFDDAYVGIITLGTPPTMPFYVHMATDSPLSFVMDKNCTACQKHNLYDSSKSTTYERKEGGFMFNTGSVYGNGIMAADTMSIEGMSVPSQTFGQALDANDYYADGVVSLSLYPTPMYGASPVINAINRGYFDKPIFTIWLDHSGDVIKKDGGEITYGGLDTIHCNSEITYQPLASAINWLFRMKSITAGSYSNTKGWDVVTSSMDSFTRAPHAIVDDIAVAIGAKMDVANDVLVFDDCETSKPPLELVIGVTTYKIEFQNYIIDMRESNVGKCVLAMGYLDFAGYGPQIILGTPFSRQYCVIYDVGMQRLGFTTPKPSV